MEEMVVKILVLVAGLTMGSMVTLTYTAGIVAKNRLLERQNRSLKAEIRNLEKIKNVQVIEINDNRAEPDSYFIPF